MRPVEHRGFSDVIRWNVWIILKFSGLFESPFIQRTICSVARVTRTERSRITFESFLTRF